ncbi:impact family protein [Cryptococcus deuterogattii 2001/935-1]|nr:impact family protein [Cryptococcus deuterogattii MMRL2647]KIS02234.1 impact family protein [Cryptococcus deuterogattii 2001/935-1]
MSQHKDPIVLANALASLKFSPDPEHVESQRRSAPEPLRDPHGTLLKFIEHLLSEENLEIDSNLTAIGFELEALLSIYGDDSIRLAFASRSPSRSSQLPDTPNPERRGSQQWTDAFWDADIGFTPGERIRYEVSLPVWEEGDTLEGVDPSVMPRKAPIMRVLVSLPPTYPNISPPQLQLLGRYLGSFAIDSGLFGDITRTYISSDGAPFTPGDSLARTWYAEQLACGAAREAQRNPQITVSVTNSPESSDSEDAAYVRRLSPRPTFSYTRRASDSPPTEAMLRIEAGKDHGLKVWVSDEVVDRKSVFVGRAVKVTDERDVPLVVHELLGDKRVARAAHPAIYAYRIVKDVGGTAGKVYNTDYDDDGESQAGGRLRHLLEILELENVMVIVTRWYGGHKLGADRFKHISKVARDALEIGGFLDEKKDEGKGRKGKK